MVTFVLYKHPKHEFTGLENPLFIFQQEDLKENFPGLNAIRDKLEAVLDKANLELDMLVVNGPSYLAAIAGMLWLTQENRKQYNMLAYNSDKRAYELHQEEIL